MLLLLVGELGKVMERIGYGPERGNEFEVVEAYARPIVYISAWLP